MAGPENAALTEVHQFDISDPHTARYVASGEVPGHIPDQWALSEHEGDLRVASTTSHDTRGSENGVTVLRPEGPRLVPVGHVGGLGMGEQIHAVRYFGDVAFVVTFRQTDPLYALDLSDPAHPAVTGELKINGVSEYLHPVGDGRLVGVGQDADEQGNTLGVQVSLFDVSDTSAPRRIHAWPGERSGPQGTGSPVEWDHHAFLWWPDSRFAVVPIERWLDSEHETHSAAVVLSVHDTVAEVGRVSHQDRPNHRRDVPPTIERSLIIGGSLYTVSPWGVLDSRLSDFADQAWVPLPA